MTLLNLWDSLLAILRKESKGLAVSPDNFSDLLQVENLSLFNDYYKGFEVNQSLTDAMQPFKAFAPIGLTYDYVTHSNYGALPSDYAHTAQIESVDVLDMVPDPALDWISTPWTTYDPVGGSPYPSYDAFSRLSNNVYRMIKIDPPVDDAAMVTEDLKTYETYDVGSTYQVELTLTDLSVSQDSDLPYFFRIASNSTSSSYTTITWGLNIFYFIAGTQPITFLFYHEDVAICDIQATFKITKKDPNAVYIFDRVTDEEWGHRRKDALTLPTEEYPIAKVANGKIYTLPISLGNVILYYLRNPATPFFDYYIDANGNIQPLAVDATHALLTDEVYRDGTTSGTVTSLTTELEWDDLDQIKILHRILLKLGVSMDEQLIAQYALSQKDS